MKKRTSRFCRPLLILIAFVQVNSILSMTRFGLVKPVTLEKARRSLCTNRSHDNADSGQALIDGITGLAAGTAATLGGTVVLSMLTDFDKFYVNERGIYPDARDRRKKENAKYMRVTIAQYMGLSGLVLGIPTAATKGGGAGAATFIIAGLFACKALAD